MKLSLRKSKCIACFLTALSSVSFVSSCQEDMKDYYEEPSWIKGSIYQILKERGDYSIFLQGVDLCNYTSILEGRSILTIMAPDDTAMRTYLQANYGTTDISTLSQSEVKKLIGFHILYYSFSKSRLENFRPNEGDGATEEQLQTNAGMYFKFRTRSQDPVETVSPKHLYVSDAGIVDTTGVSVKVYHQERFIPVFSHYMFETLLIDAKYNYEYFYPETSWSGDNGFMVSNASVTEYETIAKNGYIYFVDRVIRPLETIHKELADNANYSTFINLYDKYDYYMLDEDLTSLYGGGTETYYSKGYTSSSLALPNIDREWSSPSYLNMSALSSGGYTVFAPTNQAFDDFYMDFWGEEGTGYPNYVCYDSVPDNAKLKLLSNMYYSGMVMPEEVKKGDLENSYTGTTISFDVDAVPEDNRKICLNGAVYGQTVLTPVASFGSVTGPAYKFKKYNMFLRMLDKSSMEKTLAADNVGFIMLYPSDAQMNNQETPIWWDEEKQTIRLGVIGSGLSTTMSSTEQANYLYAHVINFDGEAEPLKSTGLQVYRTISTTSKLYLYNKNGRVSNSFLYGTMLVNDWPEDSIYANISELQFRGSHWSNGYCYQYDTEHQRRLLAGSANSTLVGEGSFVKMIFRRLGTESMYDGFARMLNLLGVYDETNASSPLTFVSASDACVMLVPTTEAIKKAIVEGRCPFITVPEGVTAEDENFWSLCEVDNSDPTACLHYAQQYFLPESTSPVTEYPYPGWNQDVEQDGGIPCVSDPSLGQMVLTYIYDESEGMSVRQAGSDKRIPFYTGFDCLPLSFSDGCVQFITDVLPDVWPNE